MNSRQVHWALIASGIPLLAASVYVDFLTLKWIVSYPDGVPYLEPSGQRSVIIAAAVVSFRILLGATIGIALAFRHFSGTALGSPTETYCRYAVNFATTLFLASVVLFAVFAFLGPYTDTDSIRWGVDPAPLMLPFGLRLPPDHPAISSIDRPCLWRNSNREIDHPCFPTL